MRIFLSTSFSHKVDYETGVVIPEFRKEIEELLAALRSAGHEVFAAIEHENWKIGDDAPKVAAKLDIEQIDRADALLALLHDKPSAGVQWEIGYANASKKKVFVVIQDNSELSYWNKGLFGLGHITLLNYDRADLGALVAEIRS